ncbi:hypothetical protein [Actinoplanes solisilvae]|uniref:hypothetical protein n=1 Tax=Actinoplanes solisilvae TaxID=2486853 RepID=UPI00196A38FF|nr:hypothetical protein [Actinoplanes solisilvae]
MSVEVRIPAHYVSSGWGTPTVCIRHGEAAVERKKVQFISPPPGWAYLLLLAGGLPFLIVVLAIRKTVEAREWPFCSRCQARRRKGLFIGLGIVAVGVLSIVLASAMPGDSAGLFMGVAPLLLLVGYIVSLRGANRMMLADGRVIEKGTLVQFRKADEAFATQAGAAAQTAAQHNAAQAAAAQAAAQQAAAQHYAVPPAPVLPPMPVLPDAATAAPAAPAPAAPAPAAPVPSDAATAAPALPTAAQPGVAEPSPAQPTPAADGTSAS